ncbi:MAG: hypothetical protein GOMPHAMPRED_005081 [Gomphillus americanus]|uniref:Uncharacterized protein n=1 Tax=Gomphillus americanus TaxID=1940652 RepID=A0A8H3EKP5_9LECA|nr:MAG: hypothetical protein GOMPHAMPRED_005081 [Gomphillus americanus]
MSFPSFIKGQLFFTPPKPTTDFHGKTIIVTGANTGLGLDCTKHLAKLNASRIILACRSLEKGEKAKQEVLQQFPKSNTILEVWPLDLASYDSVIQFADRCNSLERLDAFMENAGISTQKFSMAEEDEMSITVNVVSATLLTILLLPKLKDSAKQYGIVPVVSVVSSIVHAAAKTKDIMAAPKGKIFETLSDQKTADMSDRYNLSKLLVLLSMRELSQRIEASVRDGQPRIIVNNPAPGWAKTELFREDYDLWPLPQKLAFKAIHRTSEVASRCLIHGLTAEVDSQGEWLSDCAVKPASSFTRSQYGQDIQMRIWAELMEKLGRISPDVDLALGSLR